MFEKERQSPSVTLSYRFDLHDTILARAEEIDALELTVDHFFWGTPYLQGLISNAAGAQNDSDRCFTMVAHGVGLSLGTDADLDPKYLDKVAALTEELKFPYYSEHLAFTGVPGCELANLLPGPRTDEFAERVLRNIAQLKSVISVPILLENITRYFDWPDADYEEAEFLTAICREADTGILLDVENACVNGENGVSDPRRFVDALPPDLVWAIHTAGGGEMDGFRVDTHDQPLRQDTIDLLDHALTRHAPGWVILERDRHLEDVDGLFADLTSVREALSAASPADIIGTPVHDASPIRLLQGNGTKRNLPLGARQAALVEYLTGSAAFVKDAEAAELRPELAGVDTERLQLMAKMSRGKRIEKIRSVLPRTFQHLRPSIHELIDRFAAAAPPTSSRRIDNARQFAHFLAATAADRTIPPWAADLAAYEIAFTEVATQEAGEETPDVVDEVPFRICRSTRLLGLEHDIRVLVEDGPNTSEIDPQAQRTCLALVGKEGGGLPRVFQLPEPVFDVLKAVGDGSATELAASTGIPGELLAKLAALEIVEVSR